MTDDFVTFFGAGQETTANTLSFSFQEISRHPEIAQKAREEIDRVLGERTEVTFQDINELKYCSAIFKEALRLYPPAPSINRATPEDIEIKGYKVPKNSTLWVKKKNTNNSKIYNFEFFLCDLVFDLYEWKT